VCAPTTLAPGEPATCSVDYALTQADVDAGLVENSATASGSPLIGDDVTSAVSSALVDVNPVSSIALLKSIDRTVVAGAGADVTYTFRVTNTGQATLSALAIDEVAFSGTGVLGDIECDAVVLAPDAITDCTAGYRTTASDVTAGSVTNTAVALAEAPGGAPVESLPSSATLTVNVMAAVLASTGAVAGSMLLVWAGALLAGGAALAVVHLVRRMRSA
jgi:hypothetical protein